MVISDPQQQHAVTIWLVSCLLRIQSRISRVKFMIRTPRTFHVCASLNQGQGKGHVGEIHACRGYMRVGDINAYRMTHPTPMYGFKQYNVRLCTLSKCNRNPNVNCNPNCNRNPKRLFAMRGFIQCTALYNVRLYTIYGFIQCTVIYIDDIPRMTHPIPNFELKATYGTHACEAPQSDLHDTGLR